MDSIQYTHFCQKILYLTQLTGRKSLFQFFLDGAGIQDCSLEMIAGGCDADCHRRRFKTKLIAMAMSGYDRVIDTHVKNLRKKLEDDPKQPVYICTVHGMGYKFGGFRE